MVAGLQDQEKAMTCVICKPGELALGTATITLVRGESTVVFRGVPAQVCQTCFEEYLHEETTRMLLAITREAEKSGVKVEIRDYAA